MSKLSITGTALLAIATLGLLSGCAAAQATASDDVPDFTIVAADANAYFKDATKHFEDDLPANVAWPTSLPSTLLEDDIRMDSGVPKLVAMTYWLCAWEDQYLRAASTSNSTLKSSALAKLKVYPNLSVYKKYVDPSTASWQKSVLDPAARNDNAAIKAQAAQCGYFYDNNPKLTKIG